MRWPGRLQKGSPETTARRRTPPSSHPLTPSLFSSGSWKLEVSASWSGEKSLPACWHLLCTKLQTHKDTQVTYKDTCKDALLLFLPINVNIWTPARMSICFSRGIFCKCIYFLAVSSISQISGRRNFMLPAPLPSSWLRGEATGEDWSGGAWCLLHRSELQGAQWQVALLEHDGAAENTQVYLPIRRLLQHAHQTVLILGRVSRAEKILNTEQWVCVTHVWKDTKTDLTWIQLWISNSHKRLVFQRHHTFIHIH